MYLVTNIAIFVNILTILMFLFSELFIFNKAQQPKIKAAFGAYLTAVLALYLFALFFIVIFGVFHKEYTYLLFILCIAFPFIIGHFTEYKTFKIAVWLQIFLFFISLILLFLL